jgi:hypothetical protein
MHGWMSTSLGPERLNGFYLYSVFMSLSILDWLSVNMKIPAPKAGTLQRGPRNKMTIFPKTAVKILINASKLW